DSLADTGTASLAITGWRMSESGTNADTTYAADTGAANAGNTYSYGASGSTERALGTLLSGSLTPLVGACFDNNTGVDLPAVEIAYTGEHWRLGTADRADRLDFQVGFASNLETGTWTDVDALDFSTPVTTGSLGARDGNAGANRTTLSATVAGPFPDGVQFWIRWVDVNAGGADDGLAIDDFSITAVTGSPTPVLDIANAMVEEGDSGTTSLLFDVSVSPPAGPGGVSFDIATADVTAIAADGDYVAASLTGLTIPEGASTYVFEVLVNGDTEVEPDEFFFVSVTNISGADPGDSQAVGAIINDDVAIIPIHDIQGPGSQSPLEGTTVTTRGIVTARRGNGFFIQ